MLKEKLINTINSIKKQEQSMISSTGAWLLDCPLLTKQELFALESLITKELTECIPVEKRENYTIITHKTTVMIESNGSRIRWNWKNGTLYSSELELLLEREKALEELRELIKKEEDELASVIETVNNRNRILQNGYVGLYVQSILTPLSVKKRVKAVIDELKNRIKELKEQEALLIKELTDAFTGSSYRAYTELAFYWKQFPRINTLSVYKEYRGERE